LLRALGYKTYQVGSLVSGKNAMLIERQLSLPVNDNYNCRLNHPNLAWFSLQLQY